MPINISDDGTNATFTLHQQRGSELAHCRICILNCDNNNQPMGGTMEVFSGAEALSTGTYIHAYIYTCIHSCIHTYVYTYIHTYIYSFIHSFIHSHIHSFIHI